MAIQKSKTLDNGATGNYWKITSEQYDKMSMQASYTISLFTDKSHSDAKDPDLGLSKSYSFTLTKQELQGDRTALGYTKIKAKAASMVSDFGLYHLDTPIQFDSDLADGQDV